MRGNERERAEKRLLLLIAGACNFKVQYRYSLPIA